MSADAMRAWRRVAPSLYEMAMDAGFGKYRFPNMDALHKVGLHLAYIYDPKRGYIDELVEALADELGLSDAQTLRCLQALHRLELWIVVRKAGTGDAGSQRVPGWRLDVGATSEQPPRHHHRPPAGNVGATSEQPNDGPAGNVGATSEQNAVVIPISLKTDKTTKTTTQPGLASAREAVPSSSSSDRLDRVSSICGKAIARQVERKRPIDRGAYRAKIWANYRDEIGPDQVTKTDRCAIWLQAGLDEAVIVDLLDAGALIGEHHPAPTEAVEASTVHADCPDCDGDGFVSIRDATGYTVAMTRCVRP